MKQIILALTFLFPLGLQAQQVLQQFEAYQNSHHIEKVYISHDKPYYFVGDTIWGKVFFRDGKTHQVFDASPIVFVDWLDANQERIETYSLKINKGTASLDIPIADQDSPGVYILRAYTQYQRNFSPDYAFQKEIHVMGKNKNNQSVSDETNSDFTVGFYPEGGYLVNELPSRLAFQVQDTQGNPLDLKGELIDHTGNAISPLQITHAGIGLIEFTPESNQKYQARFDYGDSSKVFDLPQPLETGYTLRVNSTSQTHIEIQLHTNTPKGLASSILMGHIRGQIFMSKVLEAGEQKTLLIPKNAIPSGILHFTLFSNEQKPVCERLVFNKNSQENVKTNIEVEKTYYKSRELVKGSISSLLNNKIASSQLSVSVFNRDLILPNTHGLNIENYLLLQSDLQGRIHNIGQYFEANDLKTNVLLDLILLTHGWRRFVWEEIFGENEPAFTFPTKDDIAIAGRVSKAKTGENVQADVLLSVINGEDFMSLNLTTEEDGLFYFKGFQFEDTADVFIQGNIHNPKKKEKLKEGELKRVGSKNVNIELIDLNQWDLPASSALKNPPAKPQSAQKHTDQLEQFRKIDSAYQSLYSITLDEVSITRKRTTREKRQYLKEKFAKKNVFYFSSTYKVLMDDLPDKGKYYESIYDLVRILVPQTVIKGSLMNRTIHFQGTGGTSGPAKIIIDGFEFGRGKVMQLLPEQIEIIDVLTGLYAQAYDAGNVISIITREPGTYEITNPSVKPKGILSYEHPGYYQARKFYKPNYSKVSVSHQKPDLRTAIYWNSNITVKNRAENFDFYTGDIAGKYLIKVEGITDEGIPFTEIKEIEVLR